MRIPFFLAFVLFVLAEIAGFILVGETIGVLPTLGLVILGFVAGALLLRWQSIATLLAARAAMAEGRAPARQLAEGAVLAAASLLIMLPGFLTDLAGILLFVPPLRRRLLLAVSKRLPTGKAQPEVSTPSAGRVVDLEEGDYRRSAPRSTREETPWRPPQVPRP